MFSIACLGALYRLRWQIELAFKRLKSLLRIDRLPAKGDALASTWLHAHLLFALLIDAAAVEMGDFPPEPGPQRAASLWRIVALLARALLAVIWPQRSLRQVKIHLAKDPRLESQPESEDFR